MGLFDLFRKKNTDENSQRKDDRTSLVNFKSYYLYGFTDEPNRVAEDPNLLIKAYRNVIGDMGGIAVSNSFHPYFIVNQKGTTVWQAAYVKLFVNKKKDELFQSIIHNNAVCVVDTAVIFTTMHVWPDTRLTYQENPEFSKYVPFILPFLGYETGKRMRWDDQIKQGIAEKGHASDYVETVTASLRFFMPQPAFVMGFDEFDETNPSALIDNFINCKHLLLRS